MTTPTSNLGLLKGVGSDNWRTYLKTSLAASLDALDVAVGQVHNVRGYGAVGDDATDDRTAIQNAINAAAASGGTVYFPKGTYKITVRVDVPAGVSLRGADRSKCVIHQVNQYANGATGPLNAATDNDVLRITGGNVLVEDLTIRGAEDTTPTPISDSTALKGVGAKGIVVQNDTTPVNGVVLQRLTIEKVQSNGLQIWEGVQNVRVRDVDIQYVGNEGVYCSGTTTVAGTRTGRINFTGLTIGACGGWGFDTTAGQITVDNFLIENCGQEGTLYGNDRGGMVLACYADSTDVSVTHGRIRDCAGDSHFLVSPNAYLDYLTISDVVITNSSRATYTPTGLKFLNGYTGSQGTRWSSISKVRTYESNILVMHGYYITIAECQAIRATTPSAEDADDSSTWGIHVNTNGPTFNGRVTMKGCLATGWARGIWWGSCAGAVSIGNVADGNGHAGYSVNSTDRFGIGWSTGGVVTLYLSSIGDQVYNQIGGTAFSQGSGISNPIVLGPLGATVPPDASFQATLTANGSVYVGDTANTYATGPALTINQAGSDDEALALRSSDVAHGMTTPTDTRSFFLVRKTSATSGGADVLGYTSATTGVEVIGRYTTGNTTKSSAGTAPVVLQASKKSGAGVGAMGADENLVAVYNHGTGVALIDAEGDTYVAGGLRPGTDAKAIQTACALYAGTGAPNNANGANGDIYFRSDGGAGTTIYQRRAGTWTGVV